MSLTIELPFTVERFKRALGLFATGVTVATSRIGDEWHGMTANAVMSVSIEPFLVLLSVCRTTRMCGMLHHSDNFALSILAAEQSGIARYFADSKQPHDTAAFARFPHHFGCTGAPLLDGALAHVDCRIVEAYPAGDHLLYLGRVLYLETAGSGMPLLHFAGELRGSVSPTLTDHPATGPATCTCTCT